MSMKSKFLLLNVVILVLFLGNISYLIYSLDSASKKLVELENRDLKITLASEKLKLNTIQVQQWLTDISATRAHEGYDDGFVEAEAHANEFRKTIKELEKIDIENKNNLNEFSTSFESYYLMGTEMANAYIEHGPSKGNEIMDEFDTFASDINSKIENYRVEAAKSIEHKIKSIEESISYAKIISSISVIITSLITLISSYLFTIPVVNSIKYLNEKSQKYATGDLSDEIEINRKDEVGELANAMSIMQQNLRRVVQDVSLASNNVSSRSNELSSVTTEVKNSNIHIVTTIQELASGADSQAASANDLLRTMEDFSQRIKLASDSGENIINYSNNVLDMTKGGSHDMQTSVSTMKKINTIVKESVENVRSLDNETKEIYKLVNVIQEIATQTNLLSLNAAIEAARAGEQGKGFAIVANEVRKLAEQVSNSVSDITNIVTKIQGDSSKVVQTLESGYVDVEEGTKQIQMTGEKFVEIENYVSEMVNQIHNIGNHFSHLTNSSKEMNSFIEVVASVTQESAAGIEEISATIQQTSASFEDISYNVEQLSNLANQLNNEIRTFKL
ncbi:MAG: methyl-accepting chemotaxis protein [Bacillales bacterium]|nr:methyl-accepting chemotaxis protein [Bacillales bacterium]